MNIQAKVTQSLGSSYKERKGNVLFIAALGMMCSLLSVDLAKVGDWSEIYKPSFISSCLIHLGTVITAYVGGRLIPTSSKKGK